MPGAKRRNLSRQAQYGPATCGQYDPILHTWIAPPDEKAWRERERQHQHEAGYLPPLAADPGWMRFTKCSRQQMQETALQLADVAMWLGAVQTGILMSCVFSTVLHWV